VSCDFNTYYKKFRRQARRNFWDLCLRFIFGGAMVAGCFILLQLIPSKSFAGVLTVFPAIISASVIMALRKFEAGF
jgi:hypothetical protein